jgi:hypothetical protein
MTAAMPAMPQQQEPQKLAVTASSKASPLRWLTQGNPTSYNMLLFRTINRRDVALMVYLRTSYSNSKHSRCRIG